MSMASITSVIAALLVIGIFFIIMLNVDYAATALESQIEIKVYLADNLSPKLIDTMKNEMSTLSGIKSIEYKSKSQALKELEKKWGENAYLLSGLEDDNPLPDTFVVKLNNSSLAQSVALSLSSISNVDKVQYGKAELEKLLKATNLLRMGSIVIIIVLLFISIFIISNTIKLTVFARRREISIMKYVGATDWFVRGPFIVEGIILGFLGGVFSTILLAAAYSYFSNLVKQQMMGLLAVTLMPFQQILVSLSILLIVLGIVIGAIGSLSSVRKFIKV